MDPENKAALIVGSIGAVFGIFTGITQYVLNGRYKQREAVEKQGHVLTPKALLENKTLYKEPQFVMVDGLLMREKSLKYLQGGSHDGKKDKLVKKLRKNKPLYT